MGIPKAICSRGGREQMALLRAVMVVVATHLICNAVFVDGLPAMEEHTALSDGTDNGVSRLGDDLSNGPQPVAAKPPPNTGKAKAAPKKAAQIKAKLSLAKVATAANAKVIKAEKKKVAKQEAKADKKAVTAKKAAKKAAKGKIKAQIKKVKKKMQKAARKINFCTSEAFMVTAGGIPRNMKVKKSGAKKAAKAAKAKAKSQRVRRRPQQRR